MDRLYAETRRKYKQIISHLLEANTERINQSTRTLHVPYIKFARDKAIIPFIASSPKSNFMTVTNSNFFTKDDPILRYVPTVRTEQPSSIILFEGTVFGTKPFDIVDMIDLVFIRIMEQNRCEEKAVEFIKAIFGRDVSSSLRKKRKEKVSMETLFCSVCSLFECGIHERHSPRILKFDEVSGCICKSKKIVPVTTMDSAGDQSIKQEIANSILKGCVLRKIYQIRNQGDISCHEFPKLGLHLKKFIQCGDPRDAKQFYQPCNHPGRCVDSVCACERNNVLCEAFCGCADCRNVVFCSCQRCGKNCPCFIAHRECTEMCKFCKNKNTPEMCGNMPITQRISRNVTICKSDKHGIGLFAGEYIPANKFVMEYTGEQVTDKEAERRGNFYEMNGLSYLFNTTFTGTECLFSIDAFFAGNKSRFINHSVSKANLESRILVSHGNVKIVFYTIRDVYKGEEFLFDYKFTEEHKSKHGIVD